MRIFVAVASSPNPEQLPQSRLWHDNLVRPLRDLGHDVVEFSHEWTEAMSNVNSADPVQAEYIRVHRPLFSEQLLTQLRKAHADQPVDLFFSYLYSANVLPDTIREISRLGIPTVNWYCNASFQLHLVAEIAPAFDYCLVPEKFRLEDYRALGARPLYCQEAAHPDIYQPYDVPQEFDVTFVGQCYGTRPDFLMSLINAGIDARVWGPGWQARSHDRPLWRRLAANVKRRLLNQQIVDPPRVPSKRCGPPLSDQELVQMYSRSRISLGFTSVATVASRPEDQIRQVRLRDFEATMSGAFYMVEDFDELTEFFEPNREIVMFRDQEELIDKSRFYLSHPREREQIRQAGMRRARAEHTWHKRFEMVFQQIGLDQR